MSLLVLFRFVCFISLFFSDGPHPSGSPDFLIDSDPGKIRSGGRTSRRKSARKSAIILKRLPRGIVLADCVPGACDR